jgi:hypothetical protein
MSAAQLLLRTVTPTGQDDLLRFHVSSLRVSRLNRET